MKEATWYIIANPNSGGGKTRRDWAKIAQLLDKHELPYEYIFTTSKGHAIELVKSAITEGYRRFVAIGGDGTINEVVNGLFMQQEIAYDELSFGVIPVGTGSDWIKMYQIPVGYESAVQLLVRGHETRQDVGLCSYQDQGEQKQRYFVNVAGMAYDAVVVKNTNHISKSGISGQLFYLLGTLNSLHRFKYLTMEIEGDDFTYNGDVFCLNIGICKYSGGGMQLVPLSIPDDGLFDISVYERMNKLRIVKNLRRMYDGSAYEHKKTLHFRAKKLTIKSEPASLTEVDGELLGTTPVTFEILPRALKIIVP